MSNPIRPPDPLSEFLSAYFLECQSELTEFAAELSEFSLPTSPVGSVKPGAPSSGGLERAKTPVPVQPCGVGGAMVAALLSLCNALLRMLAAVGKLQEWEQMFHLVMQGKASVWRPWCRPLWRNGRTLPKIRTALSRRCNYRAAPCLSKSLRSTMALTALNFILTRVLTSNCWCPGEFDAKGQLPRLQAELIVSRRKRRTYWECDHSLEGHCLYAAVAMGFYAVPSCSRAVEMLRVFVEQCYRDEPSFLQDSPGREGMDPESFLDKTLRNMWGGLPELGLMAKALNATCLEHNTEEGKWVQIGHHSGHYIALLFHGQHYMLWRAGPMGLRLKGQLDTLNLWRGAGHGAEGSGSASPPTSPRLIYLNGALPDDDTGHHWGRQGEV